MLLTSAVAGRSPQITKRIAKVFPGHPETSNETCRSAVRNIRQRVESVCSAS
jgi:hypothetical protein